MANQRQESILFKLSILLIKAFVITLLVWVYYYPIISYFILIMLLVLTTSKLFSMFDVRIKDQTNVQKINLGIEMITLILTIILLVNYLLISGSLISSIFILLINIQVFSLLMQGFELFKPDKES